jgi:hypothetical protein
VHSITIDTTNDGTLIRIDYARRIKHHTLWLIARPRPWTRDQWSIYFNHIPLQPIILSETNARLIARDTVYSLTEDGVPSGNRVVSHVTTLGEAIRPSNLVRTKL